ncbi:Hypothetical_protein [Hexamita inflata]|uniref:Hypothetical_protein n=1 Tax=Hexamita inflata TaxID=28002 RepID=A0AA86TEV1_9EUKA|nr:Hypothetical protein HINF_LOCUS3091 [Hexamita inflata]
MYVSDLNREVITLSNKYGFEIQQVRISFAVCYITAVTGVQMLNSNYIQNLKYSSYSRFSQIYVNLSSKYRKKLQFKDLRNLLLSTSHCAQAAHIQQIPHSKMT